MSIKHTTQTTKTNNPAYDVSADAWNAAHTIDTGTITSTHVLDNTLLNADINASAAIALTKLEPDYTRPLFTVIRDGSTYKCINQSGSVVSSSSDGEVPLQYSLDNLTNGRDHIESVVWRGDFQDLGTANGFANSVLEYEGYTHILLSGTLHRAASVNKDLLRNANPAAYDVGVIIEGQGGFLDGNEGNNTSGDGIHHENSTSPVLATAKMLSVDIRNLWVNNWDNDAIDIDCAGSGNTTVNIDGVNIMNVGDYGIRWTTVADGHIQNCVPSGGIDGGIYIDGGSFVNITHCYINVGVDLVGSVQLVNMTNCTIDSGSGRHCIQLQGVRRSVFGNVVGRIGGDGETSYAFINLASDGGTHSTNNSFSNITANRTAGGTSQFDFIVEESDANQDNNTYGVINGLDCATNGARILGASSQYAAAIIAPGVTVV
jgi:hypothetical protein